MNQEKSQEPIKTTRNADKNKLSPIKSKKFRFALLAFAAILVFFSLSNLSPNTILRLYNFRGAALVVQDGEPTLRTAYGLACDVQGIENTVYSPFHVASISKQFTGTAILLLELDGKLDTTDTLDHFFTGRSDLNNVTIAHLLAMKGGFPEYLPWLYNLSDTEQFEKLLSLTYEDIESHIIANWSGAPRNRSLYSNSEYWLLGRIIEQASGMTYAEFITSRIFEPIGMTNSGFASMHDSVMPHGIPDLYFDGQSVMNALNWPFSITYATGGLISTIDDLNLWLDAYFGGKLFPTYVLDDIVLVGDYNYGWMFANDSVWSHPGAMPGFQTHILYDRSSGTRIILLSNEDNDGRGNGPMRTIVNATSWVIFGRSFRGLEYIL